MFDRLLDFGSSLDWITPLSDLYNDLNNGPHHDFHVSRYVGWSGGKIRRLLRRYGVLIWGLAYADNTIIFSVRKIQAWWTQYLLLENNIPIVGGQLGKKPANIKRARKKQPFAPKKLLNWRIFLQQNGGEGVRGENIKLSLNSKS